MNTTATFPLDYKALPLSERIQLVEDIWDSIAEETSVSLHLTDDERAELRNRLAAHQANPSSGIPWDQVRADIFRDQS
ncbi:MAG: addiction module protein [Sulfuritalea sp.]|nr:addiction module protein [Sulfuritalea sp.]